MECVQLSSGVQMSSDVRKDVVGINANSKDPDQLSEIYSLIRNFAIHMYLVPNDSVSGQ